MRIQIAFDSCWQTGFLGDNTKKKFNTKGKASFLSKGDFKGRLKKNFHAASGYEQKFVATSGTREEKPTPVTKSTILGVLCRLIGDQRPLWKAKQSSNFYFSDIVDKIFEPALELDEQETDELVYLTNKSDGRCTQQGYLGVLDNDNPWFFSDEALHVWSVIYLDKKQLLDFLLSEKACPPLDFDHLCMPKKLINRVNCIADSKLDVGAVIKTNERQQKEQEIVIDKKYKAISDFKEKNASKPPKTSAQKVKAECKLASLVANLQQEQSRLIELQNEANNDCEAKIAKVTKFLSEKFPNKKKLGEEYCKDGVIYPMSLYAAALYLQAERLIEKGLDLSFIFNEKGEIQIQGFSKSGFHGVRDWLNKMAGGRKKSVGTPCRIKKHSGKLEIEIDLTEQHKGIVFTDLTRSQEIKLLIENAGVSSFYLGKKGLAYVSNIRI